MTESWELDLARAILVDREDRGITFDEARARAGRYARWIRDLPPEHDPSTCWLEPAIRHWPGDLGFHTGQVSVVVAPQGKGKTHLLSRQIELALAHRPNWDIYNNVPFLWESVPSVPRPPRLFPVRRMSEFLEGMWARTLPAGRVPALVVDESDQFASGHDWYKDEGESWTRFLYVERHFRVRGPLLAYHVYEHVPQPLRRSGDLRGSYFRLVLVGREHRLVRQEDPSQWFAVDETNLPFGSLGLRGFKIDVDMGELEEHLTGSTLPELCRQGLDYLAAHRAAEDHVGRAERLNRERLAAERESKDRVQGAGTRRRDRIVAWWLENLGATTAECVEKFSTSRRFAVETREAAREEHIRRGIPDGDKLPVGAGSKEQDHSDDR